MNLVLAIGQILQENGLDVLYTRTTDIYETPFQKATEANEAGVDYFVSIHRNSFPTANQATGVESLIYNESGIKLRMAENINEQLADIGFRNLGVKARPNLIVLKRTQMPAVLVEVGFINNDADNQLFDDRFDDIARAIADGILDTVTVMPIDNMQDESNSRNGMWTDRPELDDSDEHSRNVFDPENHFPQEESSFPNNNTRYSMPEFRPGNMIPPNQSGNRPDNILPPDQSGNRPGNMLPSDQPGNRPGNMLPPDQMGNRPGNSPGTMPPAGGSYPQTDIYHVQTGAFRNEAYARRLLNELLSQDYPAFIDDASRYYRVRVGTFDNLRDAAAMERRLKRAGYSTVIVSHGN